MKRLTVKQNTLYNSIGSCFYLVCLWMTTVLVIRIGTIENGGILSLTMAVTNTFYTISAVGRPYQISDYKKEYSTGEYVSTRLVTGGIAFLLCGVYSLLSHGHASYETLCIIIFMCFKTVESMSDEYQAIQQIAERMDYVCISFASRGILLIGSFAATLAITGKLWAALTAMTISTGAVIVLFDIRVCHKLTDYRLEWNLRHSIEIIRKNIPLIINLLFMSACVTISRTALNRYWGNYELGVYGSVAAPTAIIQNAAVWLFLPVLPVFAKYYNEREKSGFNRLHNKMLAAMAGVAIIVTAASFFLGEWALNLVFGPEIAKASYLLIPTMCTAVLFAAENYFSNMLTAIRKLSYIVIGNVAGLCITLLFADTIVKNHGSMGVNYIIYLSTGINLGIQVVSFYYHKTKHFRNNN